MKNIIIKAVSAVLTLAVIIAIFNINVSTSADISEVTLSCVAAVVNAVHKPFRSSIQKKCMHDNAVVSNARKADCTTKDFITYTCPDCNYETLEYSSLGHFYTFKNSSYRAFNYTCEICHENIAAPVPVEKLLDIYEQYKNKSPLRNKDSMYLDIVSDGVINDEDYNMLISNTEYSLINPEADEITKKIYSYLCEINGDKTLSAQQESTWMGSDNYEFDFINDNTDKLPAMRGLDYMNDDFEGVNRRAVEWWNKGGLVTICWHTGSDFVGEWKDASNDVVDAWDKMLTSGTDEYNTMLAGMDKAAKALLELQNNGVTVLWRPFHEFDGGWFWWGKGTAENFKDMWKIMYDRYTNYWHLNNLIWVLGYSHIGSDTMSIWNPGEDYYDIMGADTYDNIELNKLYTGVNKLVANGKPVCLHECGTIPSIEEFNSYPVCYFMAWHTTYLTDTNTAESLKNIYNDDKIITLDELNY